MEQVMLITPVGYELAVTTRNSAEAWLSSRSGKNWMIRELTNEEKKENNFPESPDPGPQPDDEIPF